jgi:hypothetical protein
MRKFTWLSYDLGLQGDYEGLYAWLDEHAAVECGESMAAFYYEYKSNFKDELKQDLENSIKTDKRTRLYVVRQESGQAKGSFIIGRRKNAPWAGSAPAKESLQEDG